MHCNILNLVGRKRVRYRLSAIKFLQKFFTVADDYRFELMITWPGQVSSANLFIMSLSKLTYYSLLTV